MIGNGLPLYKGGVNRHCHGRIHAKRVIKNLYSFDVNSRIHSARLAVSVLLLSFIDSRFCMIQSLAGTRYQSVSISLIARLTTNNVIIPAHLSSLLPFPFLARIHGLSSALLLPSSSYATRKRIGHKCKLHKYLLVCFIFSVSFCPCSHM